MSFIRDQLLIAPRRTSIPEILVSSLAIFLLFASNSPKRSSRRKFRSWESAARISCVCRFRGRCLSTGVPELGCIEGKNIQTRSFQDRLQALAQIGSTHTLIASLLIVPCPISQAVHPITAHPFAPSNLCLFEKFKKAWIFIDFALPA